jgi:dTDP-4-dehydrorhamnose 3,5-epimerase
MKFHETKLRGAFIIDIQEFGDERGFFARAWCKREMQEHGLSVALAQANVSLSTKKGTMRGMHYQINPHEESKLVRCTRGSLYDVIVDLREDSPTFKDWIGVELTADNHRMLFVPEGFAHGFVTLEDDTEAYYMVTEFYTPGAEQGLRYNDPALGIEWPVTISVISDKDASWPDFEG